jgi:hypothetical protein
VFCDVPLNLSTTGMYSGMKLNLKLNKLDISLRHFFNVGFRAQEIAQ